MLFCQADLGADCVFVSLRIVFVGAAAKHVRKLELDRCAASGASVDGGEESVVPWCAVQVARQQ